MILSDDKVASKFELHYFFSDDSHSMNAVARNRCEHEVLCLINEVSSLLGVQVNLEAEALKEGGLREIWEVTGNNSNQITIILLLLTLLVTFIPDENEELEDLQIQEAQLSIEEKKLNIIKLKKELQHNKQPKSIDHDKIISDLNSHLKIITYKSNFYTKLIETKKITKIHTVALVRCICLGLWGENILQPAGNGGGSTSFPVPGFPLIHAVKRPDDIM